MHSAGVYVRVRNMYRGILYMIPQSMGSLSCPPLWNLPPLGKREVVAFCPHHVDLVCWMFHRHPPPSPRELGRSCYPGCASSRAVIPSGGGGTGFVLRAPPPAAGKLVCFFFFCPVALGLGGRLVAYPPPPGKPSCPGNCHPVTGQQVRMGSRQGPRTGQPTGAIFH